MRYSLTDLAKFQSGKTIDIKNSSGNIPIFGSNGIVGYTNESNFNNKIILGRVGACGSVRFPKGEFWATDNTLVVTENENSVYKDYLYYLLIFLDLKKYAGGSVQPLITQETLKKIIIDIPDKTIQAEISSKLKLIDNKIKNNEETIELLKLKLQSTYSYWFHQFEFPDENEAPYKSSGGSMVWNEELNIEIPKGWRIILLEEILEEINELPTKTNNICTIDLSIMPSNSLIINEYNLSDNFSTNLKILKKGTILFGLIRPYLKKCIISPIDGLVTGTVAQFKPKDDKYTDLFLAMLTSNEFFQYAINNSTGTKMPVIKSSQLLQYKIPYNEEIVDMFIKHNKSYKLIINLLNQNNELIKLKNFLLPFILTGFPK